jgi:hypothetical protein
MRLGLTILGGALFFLLQTSSGAAASESATASQDSVLEAAPAPSPNGIEQPAGYEDWRLIGISTRSDNGSMRAILGNDVAIAAARSGKTNPWPDGTILTKLVWKQTQLPEYPAATVPGAFVQAEFMVKDASLYPSTGGWGFARWVGLKRVPYGKDPGFARECFDCHTRVADRDHVFTRPATLPPGGRAR